jgi:ABC-type phosphate/phosphonate transport system substrate-binding protein
VARVRAALLQIRGPEHQAMLAKMYDIDGFEPAEDREYEVVRAAMDLVGLKPR